MEFELQDIASLIAIDVCVYAAGFIIIPSGSPSTLGFYLRSPLLDYFGKTPIFIPLCLGKNFPILGYWVSSKLSLWALFFGPCVPNLCFTFWALGFPLTFVFLAFFFHLFLSEFSLKLKVPF